tara:strand:+ start:21 stop:947 length:927 start_codon:yes stop_codon:yes gene_type:complete
MSDIGKINSILKAVDEINAKSKKRSVSFEKVHNSTPKINQNLIPKLNHNLSISPDIDKLIQEAEEHKEKLLIKTSKITLVEKTNNPDKTNSNNNAHQDIQDKIIENLYTKLKKKIKKNTLKIIFNLHLEIKDLENQLKNFQLKQEVSSNKNTLILKDEYTETSKTQDSSINDLDKLLSKNKNFLKEEVVTSLKIQDSTITLLNGKIKHYKNTEEKLRFQIIDLEQDKSILLQKIKKFNDVNEYKKNINNTKKSLKSVYSQVEKQKKIFIELKNYSTKIEQESIIYKKNYEKLIIENNGIKNRLAIFKD